MSIRVYVHSYDMGVHFASVKSKHLESAIRFYDNVTAEKHVR